MKKAALSVIIALLSVLVITNLYVIRSASPFLLSEHDALLSLRREVEKNEKFDAVVVLGAGIRGNRPTPLLEERIQTGIALFREGLADLLIMSGDSEHPADHDEVEVMAQYARESGVPAEAIRKDDLGLNTHRTVYRAKHIYGLRRILLVSQHYHLERAVYLSRSFGLETTGVFSDKRVISGQMFRNTREIPARTKDFFIGLFRLAPWDFQ